MAVAGCASLLLIALQLAGPCGAAATALPVVINTWAFRKATETGVPAGRGRAVPATGAAGGGGGTTPGAGGGRGPADVPLRGCGVGLGSLLLTIKAGLPSANLPA